MVGLLRVAEKRTFAIADRLDLGRESGRPKADGPILVWRRPLMSSAGASGSAPRRGSALGEKGGGALLV